MVQERQHEQEMEWDEKYTEMRRIPKKTRPPHQTGSLLLLVQLTACGIVLAAVLILRLVGGQVLDTVKSWYWEHLNSSIVAQEDWEEVETRFLDLLPEKQESVGNVSSDAPASSSQAE